MIDFSHLLDLPLSFHTHQILV